MLIRRCSILFLEPRQRAKFDFDSLLTGGNGLRTECQWIALAPHLEQEIILSAEEVAILGTVPSQEWTELAVYVGRHNRDLPSGLVAKGLLIGDSLDVIGMRARDDALRASHWHAQSAVAHAYGRWKGITAGGEERDIGIRSVADLIDKLGTPPTHFHSRRAPEDRIPLAPPRPTALDSLLRRRVTCRNFDAVRNVPFSILSQMLHRTFGAQTMHEIGGEAAIVKKNSPSAGGLHPTEAYLLIQHVQDVAPGLYHYHVGDHALEPVQLLMPDEALALAGRFVAEQDWFACAHVLVVLAPRFTRSFWKYRNHAKVYRAVTLDVGHLSQTLQMSATELGLGAFITAAINEVEIENALGLSPMQESPLAVCGFGWRAAERSRMEFDPHHTVWPSDARQG